MTMYMYHIRQSGDWHPPRRSLETNAEQQFFLMEHYGQPGVYYCMDEPWCSI